MIGFALGTSRRQFSLANDPHPRAARRVCVGTLGRILVLDGDLVGEKNKKRSGTRAFGEFQFRFNSRIRLRNGALNVAPRPAADPLRETIHRGRALQGERREGGA